MEINDSMKESLERLRELLEEYKLNKPLLNIEMKDKDILKAFSVLEGKCYVYSLQDMVSKYEDYVKIMKVHSIMYYHNDYIGLKCKVRIIKGNKISYEEYSEYTINVRLDGDNIKLNNISIEISEEKYNEQLMNFIKKSRMLYGL